MNECKYQDKSRIGLYIMVFAILMTVSTIEEVVKENARKLDTILAKLQCLEMKENNKEIKLELCR